MAKKVVISTMCISGACKTNMMQFNNNEEAMNHILDRYYNSDRWIEIKSTDDTFKFRDIDADNITIDVLIRERTLKRKK